MYAIKRELKLNNKETSLMRGMAGFRRFAYNFGLYMVIASWSFEGINLSDSKTKIKLSKLQWRNRNKVLGSKRLGVKASKNAKDYYVNLASHYARISNKCDKVMDRDLNASINLENAPEEKVRSARPERTDTQVCPYACGQVGADTLG